MNGALNCNSVKKFIIINNTIFLVCIITMENLANLPDPDACLVLFRENEDVKFSKDEPKKDFCKNIDEDPQYMLGTVIVRVIAARGLHDGNVGGVGDPFGGVFRSSGTPSINPYASVKFGNSTQRGSEVYATSDPIFPREEIFFLDVSLPLSRLTHDFNNSSNSNNSGNNDEIGDTLSHSPTSDTRNTNHSHSDKPNNTILTVALFHSPIESGRNFSRIKLNSEGGNISGDSDDAFLGMASIDLSQLLTGQQSQLDQWLPLHGTMGDTGHPDNRKSAASVRISCEYELSDVPPKVGDICRFNRFCDPKDLYPLEPDKSYKVEEVHNNGEIVLLSYVSSPEGWRLAFQAHKNMLICEERHVSALNTAQDELKTLGERLYVSPLVVTVTETVERVVDDGLVGVAENLVRGSAYTFNRWFKGGIDIDTIISDIQDVTNLDGRHNQDIIDQRLNFERGSRSSSSSSLIDNNKLCSDTDDNDDLLLEKKLPATALPNMPPCPITGFPMVSTSNITCIINVVEYTANK